MKSITVSCLFVLTISVFLSFPRALSHGGDNYESIATLQSCLIHRKVNNFYMYPTAGNDPGGFYYSLLNFSIQNLRFAGAAVPKPAAIVLPASTAEVADSVRCCRKEGFEIRVRSGGHSYEGSSYVSGGAAPFVVVDLMRLDRVHVDVAAATAWVQGGATLGQVYYAITEASGGALGFSAGSCPTVGAGGHIAGGGFGLLSRKHGLAADNVVDAHLVVAGGAVLDRAAMGEEVFWAIRGGGGGVWGVVAAWKIRLHPVPPTVTAFIASRHGGDHVTNLVDTWQHVAPKLPDEFYLSVFVGAGLPEYPNSGGISATFKGFFLGPKSQTIKTLQKFFPQLKIKIENCQEMTWIESILYFSGLKNGTQIEGLKDRFLHNKNYFKAKSDYVRNPITRQGIRTLIGALEKQPKGYVIMDPYGGKMGRIKKDSIAFPHREGNLFTVQYLVDWEEDEDVRREEYMEWIRGVYGEMEGHVSADPRAAYVNYVDYDLGVMGDGHVDGGDEVERARVWGEKYFLENYERLVRAKTMIDPMNVFRNQQGIPPLGESIGSRAKRAEGLWSAQRVKYRDNFGLLGTRVSMRRVGRRLGRRRCNRSGDGFRYGF
ncbi:berberine bridge enzyme-like D-2, partial [Andrographis paniculata]|uniref:berberine bridge enzyme-like D-2 n=1 Tax=Andrographis paniculata TaxID=175694 RepID=UPI0021E854C6